MEPNEAFFPCLNQWKMLLDKEVVGGSYIGTYPSFLRVGIGTILTKPKAVSSMQKIL